MPAGEQAFAQRQERKSAICSYKQAAPAELSVHELREFKQQRKAWRFFLATPASYQKLMLHWITRTKRAETRASRLAKLITACASAKRLR